MALMEISVIPVGTGQVSFGDFIAKLESLLVQEKIPHRLTDMGSQIEGDLDTLLKLAKKLIEEPVNMGVKRTYTTITIDDRRDKDVHLGEKVHSVEERLHAA